MNAKAIPIQVALGQMAIMDISPGGVDWTNLSLGGIGLVGMVLIIWQYHAKAFPRMEAAREREFQRMLEEKNAEIIRLEAMQQREISRMEQYHQREIDRIRRPDG